MFSAMPSRLFLLVSTLLSLVMIWFIYQAYQSVHVFTDPNAAASQFHKFDGLVFPVNLLLLVINIVLSIWIKIKTGNGMCFWYALLLFIFFLNLDFFWLADVFFRFKKATHLWRGGFSISGIIALVLSGMAAVATLVVALVSNWWYHRQLRKVHQ
jgi:hypothetical protein